MAPKLNDNGIPSFDDLPLRPGDPPHSAWGLYGDEDELGTLNRLSDEVVAGAAGAEIRKGTRVSLNWPLDAQGGGGAFFGRQSFHRDLFRRPPRVVNDDVWSFNSQISSHWDSLRHFAYQGEALFYNGVTCDDVHGRGAGGKRSAVNGIQAIAEKGIVGRGILADLHSWRQQQDDPALREFNCFETTPIPLEHIKACLEAQGTEVKFGDILFTRTGWHVQHAQLSAAQLKAYQAVERPRLGGVAQSDEVLRWVWDNFSAVAGDQPAFEASPARPAATSSGRSLHEVLLAGFGTPIGELFWLEDLADACRRERRWSFFLASEPCNVPGGVASPPNALAIF